MDRLTIEQLEFICDLDKTGDNSLTHRQLLDAMRENAWMKMRLAQIASGDYKVCGHFAEDVAKDGLNWNKESNNA
ncbi:MAG: hypothetical protein WC100_01455 [Sterolibacterium sp.]